VTKDKKISQQDINTWQNYIKNPRDIFDKEKSKKNTSLNNFRFKYDLHGHTLAAANIKVKEIILSCVKKNYKEILLITGKGIHSNTDKDVYVSEDLSKLRYSVPEYIHSEKELSNYVLSITNANKKDGGEGAIIIKLKKL
jgi:DNA-nicking Smr family endonuclease